MVDMKRIIAEAKARTAAGKPGAGLRGAAPLTGDDSPTVQTRVNDSPASGHKAPSRGDDSPTVETPVPTSTDNRTVAADLSKLARETAPDEGVMVVPTTSARVLEAPVTASGTSTEFQHVPTEKMGATPDQKTSGTAATTVSSEVTIVDDAKPPEPVPASEPTAQVLKFPAPDAPAKTNVQTPIETPKSPAGSKGPKSLGEAIELIEKQGKLIGTLFELVVGQIPLDRVEKLLPTFRAYGGIATVMDNLSTLFVGKDYERDLEALANLVRDGQSSFMEEMDHQSKDHVEMLRSIVIGYLINPDMDSAELGAFAKERGATRVKDIIEGLVADPNIVRSVLITEAAARNGVEPSKVREPGTDIVAKKAFDWVEAQTAEVISVAKNCIECWNQIIGGD